MRATLSIALAVILGCATGIASAAQGHRAAGGAVRHSPEPKEPEKTPIDEFERMTPEQQQKALDKLPLPHKEVLTLHFLEDFPLKTIAEIIGVPEGTVKSRLFAAKQTLRAALRHKERLHGGA